MYKRNYIYYKGHELAARVLIKSVRKRRCFPDMAELALALAWMLIASSRTAGFFLNKRNYFCCCL